MLSVQACARGLNLVVLLLRTSELDRSESIYLLEESASPFINEVDGFISEREGVRSLLSLAVHAGGYKMMAGAHNTVECQMHVGGCVVFFRYYHVILLLPRGMQGVLPCLPGTVNASTHNTIDASEARGGSLII